LEKKVETIESTLVNEGNVSFNTTSHV